MEIRLLEYFLAVAREENITRAAKSLHLTQPTLSRQLTQLEQDLGVRLFQREKRRIGLTKQGVLFRRRAQEILELIDKTETEVTEQEESVNGTISIGCGELQAVQRLVDIMVAFRAKYPGVTFNLIAGDAEQTDQRMDMGLLDLAIFLEPMELYKYNYIRLGQTEEWCVLMRADDPLSKKKFIRPTDLQNKNMIMPYRDQAYKEVASWMGNSFKEENVVSRNNLSTNSSIEVYKGMGYSLIVEGGRPYMDEKKIVTRMLSPKMKASTVLAWKQQQPLSFTVTRFVEFAETFLNKGEA